MTTLPNLADAPADAAEGDLLYTRPTTGAPNAKRTFGSLWRNALGRSAATARGFFGATPVAQPAGAAQAGVPATPISGTAGGAYTATEQQLINDLKAQVTALTVLCNAQRSARSALSRGRPRPRDPRPDQLPHPARALDPLAGATSRARAAVAELTQLDRTYA